MTELAPNHHADYPQFTGLRGYLGGLTMIAGRGRDARLVTELAAVGPADHVVDIGCGPGTAVRTAARRAHRVVGVDPSAPMLALGRLLTRVRRPAGEIEWMLTGAEALTLPDEAVTVVWSLASVHHWPQLEAGIDEAFRVLQPGGTFIALERRSPPDAKGIATHGWTPDQAARFRHMLEEHGFVEGRIDDHDLGRRKVVTVTAVRPT